MKSLYDITTLHGRWNEYFDSRAAKIIVRIGDVPPLLHHDRLHGTRLADVPASLAFVAVLLVEALLRARARRVSLGGAAVLRDLDAVREGPVAPLPVRAVVVKSAAARVGRTRGRRGVRASASAKGGAMATSRRSSTLTSDTARRTPRCNTRQLCRRCSGNCWGSRRRPSAVAPPRRRSSQSSSSRLRKGGRTQRGGDDVPSLARGPRPSWLRIAGRSKV